MAWLGTITAAGTIIQSQKFMINRMWVVWGTTTYYTQTRTITVTTYPGLTLSMAATKAAADILLTNCTDSHTSYNQAGGYTVQTTIDVTGAWIPVP